MAADLPSYVQAEITKLPVTGKVKLQSLYKQHKFSEVLLDTYKMNNNDQFRSVEAFETYLVKEAAKKGKAQKEKEARLSLKSGKSVGAVTTPTKRTPVASPTNEGMQALLNMGLIDGNINTPPVKRMRESVEVLPASLVSSPPKTPNAKSLQFSPTSCHGNSEIAILLSDKDASVEVRDLLDPASLCQSTGLGYRFMNEPAAQRADAADQRLLALQPRFLEEMEAKFGAVPGVLCMPSQQEVALCGRILCEGLEGKLNEWSMLLEGPTEEHGVAPKVQLSASSCQSIGVFPGQIVGVVGRSGMSGQSFHANKMLTGLPVEESSSSPSKNFQMMVASGPYCLRDGLDFSPLEQLLKHIVQRKPQVLVLMGPFLDANNLLVASGATKLPGEKEARSYDEIYTEVILPLLVQGLAPLRQGSNKSEVLLVPSLDEVLSFHPLPQPPLDATLFLGAPGAFEPLKALGVRLASNPSHVEIGGLRVSLTSADALQPVVKDLVLRPVAHKLHEGLKLLARQRTLFPTFPREPGHVSERRSAACHFPEDRTPDVVIFPTQMGSPGANFLEGACFLNPGVVCRGQMGTFAEISARPRGKGQSLESCLRVEIQKISAES